MCSRLIGRLLGSQGPIQQGQIGPLSFFAYKAADSTGLVEAYRPDRQFLCTACGGAGVLDDLEFLSTYYEPTQCADVEPRSRARGRPAKAFKPIATGPSLLNSIDAA
ncbi:MAG: hypothetical protein JOZ87_14030 [Chloroflexi bacterium]|nr:hypothetical protein [Chloroflexota bacterium]